MNDEMHSLLKNHTWDLVRLPERTLDAFLSSRKTKVLWDWKTNYKSKLETII